MIQLWRLAILCFQGSSNSSSGDDNDANERIDVDWLVKRSVCQVYRPGLNTPSPNRWHHHRLSSAWLFAVAVECCVLFSLPVYLHHFASPHSVFFPFWLCFSLVYVCRKHMSWAWHKQTHTHTHTLGVNSANCAAAAPPPAAAHIMIVYSVDQPNQVNLLLCDQSKRRTIHFPTQLHCKWTSVHCRTNLRRVATWAFAASSIISSTITIIIVISSPSSSMPYESVLLLLDSVCLFLFHLAKELSLLWY